MSPKVLVLAAALASSTALVPAFANQPADNGATPPPPAATAPQPPVPLRDKVLFNLLDRNGDGAIDQDELAALTKAVFAAADTNGDGKISAEEFDKALPFGGGRPGMMMGHFMHHGPDGPGFDGPRFGGPGFGPRFGMDGHPHHPHWQQGQRDDDRGPGPADLGDNQDGNDQPGAPPSFASLDKNGDGVITPDEFQSGQPVPPAPAPQQ
jgi:hypothetical protein